MTFSTAIAWIAAILVPLCALIVLRFLWIYREIQQRRTGSAEASPVRSKNSKCKTLVVLGSGGHTSEMLHMVRQLDASLYDPFVYVVADTDHTSIKRLEATSNKDAKPPIIYRIPRSREVGQSYVTSLLTTIHALFHAIILTIQIRPELVLCNGPGTCVPVVLGAWMLRMAGWPTKFLFCESFCRVETLSLTGKLLYPIVDSFIVHWEALHKKYPNSHLSSTFVNHDKMVKQHHQQR